MLKPNPYQNIKAWAEGDRPREKLAKKGASILSDAELIALLIGSGKRKMSAVALAKLILQSVDHNLNELSKLDIEDFCRFNGIGKAKAITIIAALELGKRRREAGALNRNKITSSKDAFELMLHDIGDLLHEEFWVIFLNNANEVITKSQLSKGGITGTVADVRTIFKRAIQYNATAIIVCHNHPSGQLKPSDADIKLTKKLKQAGHIMDIKVLDHIIVTQIDYYSFADHGNI